MTDTQAPVILPQLQPKPAKATSEFPLLWIEVVSVVVAVAVVAAQLVRFALAPEMAEWTTLVALVPALLAGILLADFVSGMLHWVGDTWGTEESPWLGIGMRLIKPFRFHHKHPLDMLKSNFFTTNGDTALASMPFLIAALCLPLSTLPFQLLAVFFWAVGAWGMWTSQFHLWAHMKSPPRLARVLQRTGIILTPSHHHRHHKVPYRANYCITTGWCNPFLTRIRFFPAMEWAIVRFTPLRPRQEAQRPV